MSTIVRILTGAVIAVAVIAVAGGFRRTPTRASVLVAYFLIGASVVMIVLAVLGGSQR